MESFSNLEVIITFEKELYKAACPSFPKCTGKGKSESEALVKLSGAISRYISKVSKEAFNRILLSEKYTEVMLDTTEAKKKKLVFSLEPSLLNIPKSLSIKMKPAEFPVSGVKKDIRQLFQNSEVANNGGMMSESFGDPLTGGAFGGISYQTNQAGIVFGFPLSFN